MSKKSDSDLKPDPKAEVPSETSSPKQGVPDDLTDLRQRVSTLENQMAQMTKDMKTVRR